MTTTEERRGLGRTDGRGPGDDGGGEVAARSDEARYRSRYRQDWDRVAYGSHCVDCLPTNCPLLVYVKDGRVVREELAGNLPVVEEGVPDANPMGCQKGLAWSAQLDSPDRVLYPLRRAGERGDGHWTRISWDDALAEVADAIIDAVEEIGPEAVVHEGTPEIAAVIPASRLMKVIGGTHLDVNGSINDFWPGTQQVFGKFFAAASVDDWFHSDCILVWHSNPAYTMSPSFHYITEARYRGAHVVLISTDVSPSHSHADVHVPVRHGTDAALALAMCQVVLSEGLADLSFVARQTDLSLLVHTGDGPYLRASDLDASAAADRFFHAHPDRGVVPADPASLDLDFEPALEGSWTVTLADGREATVEPLMTRVRRMLDASYTPEVAGPVCGVHPDTIRHVARIVARSRTRILPNAGLSKYFHGDLMNRSMLLLLALTGNWGKKGTGTSGWSTGLFDGQTVAMSKPVAGPEGAEQVVGAMEAATAMMRELDPTLNDELAATTVWRAMGSGVGMSPPAFFWYWHAGFRERWNDPRWADPTMPRSFDEHWDEAMEAGMWATVARPGPDRPPRVLLEIAGNILRRTRGGQGVVLEHLWPQLSKVVVVDWRMSQTALHADLVLPAAQHYEKIAFGMPTPWTMSVGFSDAAVEPAGEARGEWEMLADLCRVIGERAEARGLESYRDGAGGVRRYAELWDAFTFSGRLTTQEAVADEMVRDAVHAGNLAPGTSLDTLREKGWTGFEDWGLMTMAKGQSSPFPKGETHAPLRSHVEAGDPYPTLTRRAQFLIDHPWYREAGEDLPVHKEPPPMGGQHPFRLSGGHNRWSVHAMNTTNPVLLQTHRGKPFVLVSSSDAADRGIADDDPVRIWNDAGEVVVHARLSPAQRPGALTIYNGFEGFMFPGGKGPNELEPGLVKWLHLVNGYGQMTYAPTEWQPTPFDRCLYVDVEPARS